MLPKSGKLDVETVILGGSALPLILRLSSAKLGRPPLPDT